MMRLDMTCQPIFPEEGGKQVVEMQRMTYFHRLICSSHKNCVGSLSEGRINVSD
jgi:hypothetical protein